MRQHQRRDPIWNGATMLWLGRWLWSEHRSLGHGSIRSLGRASLLAGTVSKSFPLARSLPACVNTAVAGGKHVFLGRLLFLEEVSWWGLW